MATIYLSSVDGSDGDGGTTWALAKATLAAALTAAGAGGRVYMDDAHAETQASAMTLTSPGTVGSPVEVLCSSRASGAPPTTLATTGTVSTTGANSITSTGYTYFYGVTFSVGDGANAASITTSTTVWVLDSCILKLNNTSSSSRINLSSSGSGYFQSINTTYVFGAVGQGIAQSCAGEIVGGSVALTGTVPTAMIVTAYGPGVVHYRGVDLSAFTSGKVLSTVAATFGTACQIVFRDCKLAASVAVTSGTPSTGVGVYVINSDPSLNYRNEFHGQRGVITTEATIVRTGGSTNGTTPFSHKMVSASNTRLAFPLISPESSFWNQTVGSSVTVEAEIVTDNVGSITDAEAWIEVDYLGTSGVPIATNITDRAADILATPANQATSTVDWTTTGLGTPTKQKLSVSFTPQVKGLIRARVVLAKASTTMYVDQLRVTGSGRQYVMGMGGVVNEGSGGGVLVGGKLVA